jgi:hypothetical protein
MLFEAAEEKCIVGCLSKDRLPIDATVVDVIVVALGKLYLAVGHRFPLHLQAYEC